MPEPCGCFRRARRRAEISQEEIARRVGCTRQTIVNCEQRRHEPRVLLAIAIARALGVEVVELWHPLETAKYCPDRY